MSSKSPDYFDVDAAQKELVARGNILEQLAGFYGIGLPEVQQVGREVRTACFLDCGKTEETGSRAVAVRDVSDNIRWRCHQYGCGKGGNLATLCGYLRFGSDLQAPLRGEQFRRVRDDLRAMVGGATRVTAAAAKQQETKRVEDLAPTINVPLAQSDNERARALVNLDEKFLIEVGPDMNRDAAAYFRKRPYLTPEVCRAWRIGYLPRDTGGDKSGGTMRGKMVYPSLSETGELLAWFGRDPQFEEKHRKWVAAGRNGREPQKVHFVKGFHRGLELFGQHRLHGNSVQDDVRKKVRSVGLIVVEGPNDVIRLDTLDVPAVALCSNTITSHQAEKTAQLAHALCYGTVTLMLDCDAEGEAGSKQAVVELAKHCRVQFGWARDMYDGKFVGQQPESLTPEGWQEIQTHIAM